MPTHRTSAAFLCSLALLQALPAMAQLGMPRVLLPAGPTTMPAPRGAVRTALRPREAPRLELRPESRVWVDGTSNKNDWTVKATELSGFVHLQVKGDVLEITGGGFTVAARKLVSEHGVIMDRLMQGALKSGTHPSIIYELVSAAVTPLAPGKYAVATQGRVTIAGVTKDVAQTVSAERLPDGRLRFTGSQPILMNEYGMTPPTAMFGALRAGNRVVVNFELVVKP